MKKNVASQIIGAEMIDASTGAGFSGTVTCYVTGDNGTQTIGSVGSGVCTSKGNGLFNYVPAQAETNYDFIQFTFIGTGAVAQTVELYTEFPQTGDSFARIGAPIGASISADIQTRSTFASGGSVNTTQWAGVSVTGMPMPTYAQPTGFLAATFPTSVGTSTLTQAQVTGGAYALNSASFAFNAALPFTTAQLAQTVNANMVSIAGDTGAPSSLAGLANAYNSGTWVVDINGAIVGDVTGNIQGDVQGDVDGKVLGGGESTITGIGAQVSGGGSGPTLSQIVDGVWTANIADYLEPGQTGYALYRSSVMSTLVWDEPLASHLSAGTTGLALSLAGTPSDGLSGPSSVTLTYVDSNGDPVPLVEFSVVGQGVQRALVDGTASFGLNDGTYTVVSGPVGGVMFPDTALTVSGSGAATIVGYTVNIVPPSDPTLCVVYGFAVKNDGSKAANVPITFIVSANIPAKTAGGRIIAYVPVNETTDDNGFFQATLIRDKAYQINSPTLRFNGTVFTPTGSSYDLSTAIT